MKKVNKTRLTELGKQELNKLISNSYVDDFHKTLLRGIENRAKTNNLSFADTQMLNTISNIYS